MTLYIASRKRILLALYLDYIIFSVPLALIALVAPGFSFWLQFATFVVLELALVRVFQFSLGFWLLGMHPGQGTLYVESGIAARESKFSMLLGTLLLLAGSKTIVRLTQFGTPIPAFGATVGAMPGAVQVVNGLLSMLVAVLVLRLDRRALSAGMAYVGIGLVATVLSWSQFDPWVAQMAVQRRALQGLSVPAGEVEFMQRLFPEGVIALLIVYAVAFVVLTPRLARRAT